ncbi:MAG TPA: serine hydrolase [Bacteroidia bacterium]|jgi:CubicO group peptidase (beta-lactamase class C family)
MRFLKKFFKWFFIILVVLNVAILVSGKTYLYKGIWNTYLKGRSGPSIDEYHIFANNKVEASSTPWEWPTAKDYNTKKISDKFRSDFERLGTVSYLVIKDDSIRYEEYWDGYSDTSHSNSFSMAKTFVSILCGIAINEGKIKSVDDPVCNYLPEYFPKDKKGNELCGKLTIKHLLTMSSGINFDEDYVSPFAYPAQAYYGSDLESLTKKYTVTTDPGKTFIYLSGNSFLLSRVIEKATGKTLSEYASEKLWKPIGAKSPAYWSLDHEGGYEKAYCCFNSNARDFARFGRLYLDSGKWNTRQIVPMDYVLSSVKPAALLDENGKPNDKYGYSWWLLPHYKGHDIFYARGILGQYIVVIPDKKMIVVRLGKKREIRKGDEHPADLFWYIDAALEMYP